MTMNLTAAVLTLTMTAAAPGPERMAYYQAQIERAFPGFRIVDRSAFIPEIEKDPTIEHPRS